MPPTPKASSRQSGNSGEIPSAAAVGGSNPSTSSQSTVVGSSKPLPLIPSPSFRAPSPTASLSCSRPGASKAKRKNTRPEDLPLGMLPDSFEKPVIRKFYKDETSKCAKCGMNEPPPNSLQEIINWEGCSRCQRWFHLECIKKTKQDTEEFRCKDAVVGMKCLEGPVV